MKKQKTFTKDEILEMIDEAMRCVKGGDDYPPFGSEQDKEFQLYGAGISYLKGWLQAGMDYKITGKFELPTSKQKGEKRWS